MGRYIEFLNGLLLYSLINILNHKNWENSMQKIWKGSITSLLFVILGVAALIILIHYSEVNKYVSLQYLQLQADFLKLNAQQNYVVAAALYVLIFTLFITIMPFVIPFTLMGGFLFGTIPGFLLSLLSATTGSVISFLVIRTLIGPIIRKRFQNKLNEFDHKMKQHGASYLLTINLLSAIPYIVVDVLAALTNISLFTFIWTFIAGNIPVLLILSHTGQQLASIKSFGDILTPSILLGFGILAVLALLPIILKRFNFKL